MGDVLIGLLIVVLGLGVAFLGLRLWFIMLPIWGFIAGFFVGLLGVTALFGDGFFSTLGGWVAGIVVGIILAGLAYLFWYAGALLAAGSVGALIATALMAALNVETTWVITLVAIIGAAALVLLALVLALPIYIVVINTALTGAAAAVVGTMLVFDRIDRGDLQYGATWAMWDASWVWTLAWLVVAVAGVAYQLTQIESVALPTERWVRAEPGADATHRSHWAR